MTQTLPPQSIILYADDDVDDLQLVQESFAQYSQNVAVVTKEDGAQALSYLNSLSKYEPAPCLIILDINMPRINGIQVLMALRQSERYKDVPVILFTTSSQPVDRAFAEKYNAGFLTKPIEMRQMEAIIDEFINNCTDEVQRKIRK